MAVSDKSFDRVVEIHKHDKFALPLVRDLCVSLYAFHVHVGQVNSTVLRQVDHCGQHGKAAHTMMQGETCEADFIQKRLFRNSAICQPKKALTILRCWFGSEMVLSGVVIGDQKMPYSDISQENDHAILMRKCQLEAYNFK